VSRPAVLLDLDSTICDTRHRRDYIPTPDNGLTWVDYSMQCHGDTPVDAVATLIRFLAVDNAIVVLSGRDQSARDLTESWFNLHEIPFDDIYLRPDAVTIPNEIYKSREIHKIKRAGFAPWLMLDDWPPVKVRVEEDHPDVKVVLVSAPDNHEAMDLFSQNHATLL
jgi:hypothetical protein